MVLLYKTKAKYKTRLESIDGFMGFPLFENCGTRHGINNGPLPIPDQGFYYFIDCTGQEGEVWYEDEKVLADDTATKETVEAYEQSLMGN